MTDLDEWRTTVADMSELERLSSCRHSHGRKGICRFCGDDEARKDANV